MAQTIRLRRSAVPGKVPSLGQLALGELGMNTYDGKITFERSGSSETVESIFSTNTLITGSLIMLGDQHVTGSVNIQGTASADYFVGDGSGLTNVTAEWDGSHIGDANITGSLTISSSANDTLIIQGSGSNILTVAGSQGTLWTVTDSLSGSLFAVGDISGFAQFEVMSSGDVYLGDEASIRTLHRTSRISTVANVTESITTLSTSSFDGAFFDYIAQSGSNARAGSIMGVWNGGNVQFTDNSTSDIGGTDSLILSVGITGSEVALQSVSTVAGWEIKVNTRSI